MNLNDKIRVFEQAAKSPGEGHLELREGAYYYADNNSASNGKILKDSDLIKHAKKILKEAKGDSQQETRLHEVIKRIAERKVEQIQSDSEKTWWGNIPKKIFSKAYETHYQIQAKQAKQAIHQSDHARILIKLGAARNLNEVLKAVNDWDKMEMEAKNFHPGKFEGKLIEKLKELVDQIDPSKYGDQLRVDQAIEDLNAIKNRVEKMVFKKSEDVDSLRKSLDEKIKKLTVAVNEKMLKQLGQITTLKDIPSILHTWKGMSEAVKKSMAKSFETALKEKLAELSKVSGSTYDDLLKAEQARKDLNAINSLVERMDLKKWAGPCVDSLLQSLDAKVRTLQQTDAVKEKVREMIVAPLAQVNSLEDIASIVKSWQTLSQTVKDCLPKEFEEALFKKLSTLVDGLPQAKESATYEDLQTVRAARRALLTWLKDFGNIRLQNEKNLKEEILKSVDEKIDALLKIDSVKKAAAQEKIAARWKGVKTRNQMVTTRQMVSILQNRLLGIDPGEIKNISRALCRQINEMMENPNQYKGRKLPLNELEKSYPFFSLDHQTKETFKLHFRCILEMSEDGKTLDLVIIPPNQFLLGEGTYKKVFKAQSFKISFKVEREEQSPFTYQRKGQYSPEAFLEAISQDSAEGRNKVGAGIEAQKKLERMGITGLPSLPETKPLVPGEEVSHPLSTFRQGWYNSDLYGAMTERSVPLDFGDNPRTLPISTAHLLGAIIDVGTSLASFHRAGMVHGDVKPANILLQVSPDETTVRGVPIDFDFTQASGLGLVRSPYQFWDKLSQEELGTHFTDVYGLGMTLGEAILPRFSSGELDHMMNGNYVNQFISEARRRILRSDPQRSQESVDAELRAIRLTFELVQEIIAKSNHLKFTIKVDNDHIRRVFQDFEGQQGAMQGGFSDLLAKEIDDDFNRVGTPFAEHVVSEIPGWENLSSQQKVRQAKQKLRDLIANEQITPGIRSQLTKDLAKIEARQSAFVFMLQASADDPLQHPLYAALQHPEKIDTDEAADSCLDKEIENVLSRSSPEVQAVVREVGAESLAEKRKAIKEALQQTINSDRPRADCSDILEQITRLEQSMDYVIERRDYYRGIARQVASEAMSMETFVERVKAIKTALTV